MAVNGSQQGSSWDPHTAFKIVASQHAPPSLQTMLRLRLAAQQQVRPGVHAAQIAQLQHQSYTR